MILVQLNTYNIEKKISLHKFNKEGQKKDFINLLKQILNDVEELNEYIISDPEDYYRGNGDIGNILNNSSFSNEDFSENLQSYLDCVWRSVSSLEQFKETINLNNVTIIPLNLYFKLFLHYGYLVFTIENRNISYEKINKNLF